MSTSAKDRSILNFFKKFLPGITESQLIRGSLIMLVGTMVANIGNYLYHLLMGRMLGPEGYGVLASVISVGYLLFILINTLSLTIAKFVANFKGKKDFKGIAWLWRYLNRQVFFFSGLICITIIVASFPIASFLHLESVVSITLIGFLFLTSSFSTLNRATLQGLLLFPKMVVSHIGEIGLKLISAVILVWWGMGVEGAVLALVIGSFVGYGLAHVFLNSLRKYSPKKPDFNSRSFLKFSLPVFLFNLSFTSLYTNDIILVKHLFSSYEAGLYAALALLGKIVFFATSSIPAVMFPMVANRHSQGKNSRHLFSTSLAIVSLVSSVAVITYFLFPKLMILLLFGKDYLVSAPLLGWMAIFIAIYSLAFLLVNFFLSVDKVKPVIFPVFAAGLQIVLISLFHQSLRQVIQVSIGISGLLLFCLVLYYFYEQKKTSFSYRSRL